MAKLKIPAKPKLLSYRKKPKHTASNAVLERYLHHVKEVDAKNKAKIAEWHAKKKHVLAEHKKSEHLKKVVASVTKADHSKLLAMRTTTTHHKRKHTAVSGTKRKKLQLKKQLHTSVKQRIADNNLFIHLKIQQ